MTEQPNDQHAGADGADEPVTVDAATGQTEPAAEAAQQDDAAPAEAEEDATDVRIVELTTDLQRERAQFANFRRRAAEEKQGSVAYGKQVLIDKLLPVLDDLDRARTHGDLDDSPLRAVADKLADTLTGEGLARFGEPGDVFDPELHEAVQHDGTGDTPVLDAVYRVGYRLGEKVIRTAMVTVTDPEPGADPAGEVGATPEAGNDA